MRRGLVSDPFSHAFFLSLLYEINIKSLFFRDINVFYKLIRVFAIVQKLNVTWPHFSSLATLQVLHHSTFAQVINPGIMFFHFLCDGVRPTVNP